jgi:hypothetical protein
MSVTEETSQREAIGQNALQIFEPKPPVVIGGREDIHVCQYGSKGLINSLMRVEDRPLR